MSFERFDEARNSYGTDEDLIFVAAVNEESFKFYKQTLYCCGFHSEVGKIETMYMHPDEPIQGIL